MKVTTKGRYALRMLINLCQHENQGFIPLKEIASRQKISKKYLEQIIPLFNETDILVSARGNQGGYRLGRLPEEVSVGEILSLAEGDLVPVNCVFENPKCENLEKCLAKNLWRDLDAMVRDYLNDISLQDVLDQKTT